MRLGGPIFGSVDSPEHWVEGVQRAGYRAAYCPVGTTADDTTIAAYVKAAKDADIVIAEVGAWINPMAPDPKERAAGLEKCKACLLLAEKFGARCCVNIVGSLGSKWDGPHPDNLTDSAFDRIVATTREIIDAVKPTRTYFTLETMPYMYPDSADAYVRLIQAIDRPSFAVHLDPVNLVSSPQRYYRSGDLIRECVEKLGPRIKSCHAKDIILRDALTVHLDEIQPGKGGFDYPAYLRALQTLDPDLPLMLEHLKTEAEYVEAAGYVRGVAKSEKIPL